MKNRKELEFVVKGSTYKERKESLRDLALDYQLYECENSGGLSYGELAEIQEFFETNGKRYGLLREFRENGIC